MLWKLARTLLEPRPHRLTERALEMRRRGDLLAAERLLRDIVARFPGNAAAIINLGLVLIEQHKAADGAAELQRGLALDPENTAAHYNLATLLRVSGRHEDAIRHYELAADLPHAVPQARQELMFALLEVCDWDAAQRHADILRTGCTTRAADWARAVAPLTAIYLGLDRAQSLNIAAWHAAELARGIAPLPRAEHINPGERLRVAYLSPDFRDHPVGQLMSAALHAHDRDRFQVFAYSYGPDDGSEYRHRIAACVDRFVDLAAMDDHAAAVRIAADGIQVLVDLAGHTSNARLGILARRPAPIQAHYLGYPATTGASYIDYFISDRVATPSELADAFSEQLACVPECFMAGESEPVMRPTAREAEGLPGAVPVYACFANGSRITRAVFAHWMEVLRAVPGSVLWLSNTRAEDNLRSAARSAGLDPQRLVFARRTPRKADHFARLGLADLALDTVGWHNGHSTTHDMLCAGLPVLTVPGETFASRVGASLVSAADLPELVAPDPSKYVETAIELGLNPDHCARIKNRLAANRRVAPLFDTRRLVAGLEALYQTMWYAKLSGQPLSLLY